MTPPFIATPALRLACYLLASRSCTWSWHPGADTSSWQTAAERATRATLSNSSKFSHLVRMPLTLAGQASSSSIDSKSKSWNKFFWLNDWNSSEKRDPRRISLYLWAVRTGFHGWLTRESYTSFFYQNERLTPLSTTTNTRFFWE